MTKAGITKPYNSYCKATRTYVSFGINKKDSTHGTLIYCK